MSEGTRGSVARNTLRNEEGRTLDRQLTVSRNVKSKQDHCVDSYVTASSETKSSVKLLLE